MQTAIAGKTIVVPGDWRRPNCPETYPVTSLPCGSRRLAEMPASWEDSLSRYDCPDEPYHTRVGLVHRGSRRIESRAITSLAWKLDRRREKIPSLVTRLHGGHAKVLDVGCGRGHLMADLFAEGHWASGIEPDEAPRAAAIHRMPFAKVWDGTCDRIPEEAMEVSWNAITLSHVLNVVIDPVSALRNLFDLLVPGGRLVIEVPNRECLAASWYGLAWGHSDTPRNLHDWTAAGLRRVVERAGLTVEELGYCCYVRQFLPEWLDGCKRRWDFFNSCGAGRDLLPVRPSRLSQTRLLIATAKAPDPQKYDSMRLVARSPQSHIA